MSFPAWTASALMAICVVASGAARAQDRVDPTPLIAAQRDAMAALKAMDGVWRGPAWTLLPSGAKRTLMQTERIGPFLDGSLKVIEGRGHEEDGRVTFNALGIVSYDVAKQAYSLHSYALGHSGDFAFRPTADGYAWSIPAGPSTIQYVATIRNGELHEVGDMVTPGKDPVRIFEMTLKRVADTDWPVTGAIGPR